METSETIAELAKSLAKAQAVIGGALKDSSNPFFKSKYADLESVWTACRKALTDHGLSVVQTTDFHESCGVLIVTTLLHSSGEWIRGRLPIMAKDQTPQGIGSAITYARRYALAAIAGVYQTDDDGEAAHGRKSDARGDGADQVPQRLATDLAHRMSLALDADVTEDVKALKIYDIHAAVKAEHDLYIAAAELLPAKSRSAWKQYVKQAEKIGNEPASLR